MVWSSSEGYAQVNRELLDKLSDKELLDKLAEATEAERKSNADFMADLAKFRADVVCRLDALQTQVDVLQVAVDWIRDRIK